VKNPPVEDAVWSTKLRDLDTYERANKADDGSYEFEWIIRFINEKIPVRFQLQHHYARTIAVDPLQYPPNVPVPAVPQVENAVEDRYFLLPDSPSPLDLEYYPAAKEHPEQIGKLYQRTSKGLRQIQLDTEPAATQGAFLNFWRPFQLRQVLAADQPCSRATSDQDREKLLDQLGGDSLPDQVAAREYLVQQRGACLSFIAQGLADPSSTLNRQRSVLIANLTAAIDAIAKEGVTIPGALYAQAGTWQYNLAQFRKAVEYFRLVDQATFDKNPQLLYYAAYSETKGGEPEKAIALFRQYEAKEPQLAQSSAAVRGNLGIAYYQLAKKSEAGSDLRGAIGLYEQSDSELQRAVALAKTPILTTTLHRQLGLTEDAEQLAKQKLQLQQGHN
jgi:tetratricopeptide (TPR) repeat protein